MPFNPVCEGGGATTVASLQMRLLFNFYDYGNVN